MTTGYPGGWKRWYSNTALALLAGACLALLWAIPAAIQGGEAYREMILWGQTTGRMVQSFAHARPWWWYLPILPILLLPWSLWLPLWRGLPGLRAHAGAAERFCLAWFVPGLLAFSAISGKQVHYLLPLLPALILLGARALEARADTPSPGRLAIALALAVCLHCTGPYDCALPGHAAPMADLGRRAVTGLGVDPARVDATLGTHPASTRGQPLARSVSRCLSRRTAHRCTPHRGARL
ncbi:hypothetical protein G3O07_22735 [Pseudomonas laurentiana]|uniref:Glycosyltransferase family 39 protein n=1 Tax=Pseudomonas laurentiana TaxID=2364649 RepID=A0A6I5RVW6_9PSED|nr:hypothetical protein [Pseudomonas laurentiana]